MLHNQKKIITSTYKKVFYKKIYVVVALIGAITIFWISSNLTNITLLLNLPEQFTFTERTRVFFASFATITTSFRFIDQFFIIIISLLAGINIALTTYQLRTQTRMRRASGIGIIGTVIAFFGIGCSTCGSLILASILGIGVTASITNALPLHGSEFALFGIIILLAVNYYASKKITSANIC